MKKIQEVGQRVIEVNARGRIVRELQNTFPKPGKDFPLHLTKTFNLM
ncbi:MAG: hypothetical protein H6925_06665 [Holosporaceae bacterium]|nr:MAG: hypothetical protein H6925_06665 [Holosporaceae bacterium]